MAALDSSTEQTLRAIIENLTLEELIRYHHDAVDSEVPAVRSSAEHPEDYEFFALVVDGVVSAVHVAHKEFAAELAAALSANPKVVHMQATQKNVVQPNWTYDETTGDFTANNQ